MKNSITLDVLLSWVEAFSTSAIEGNKEALRMLDLWKTDKLLFIKTLLEEYSIDLKQEK